MSQTSRRAVVDIGTNSVKLLIAAVGGGEVQPLCEESKQTRLGQGFYETHELQPGAVTQTAAAISKFVRAARARKVESIRVIATSAARDAKNPEDLLQAVKRAVGLDVEIISGKQEADWAFQGVTSDPELASRPLLLLDAGGGSTEFILGCGLKKYFRRSFPLGTVRLLEKFPPSDPPLRSELTALRAWLHEFLKQRVAPRLAPKLLQAVARHPQPRGVQLVGTGGTASILARMEERMDSFDREQIEQARLTRRAVRAHVKKLWSLPLVQRKKVPGLPPNRADVILMGALIYEAVMEEFGLKNLRVSTRGLRYAAMMDESKPPSKLSPT